MNGAMKLRFTFALMTGVAAIALAPRGCRARRKRRFA
jgi:hypothetical protein